MVKRIALSAFATAGIICASGAKPNNPPPPAPNSAELRISNEIVPAGGTVQIKYAFTNPTPIWSGGMGLAATSLDGVALWNPAGDAAGVAVLQNGFVHVSVLSPSHDLGMLDYPFLTVTTNIPSTLKTGTTIPLTISSADALFGAAGPLNITVKPGTLLVGGTVSIHNVRPGGGTWPAGTTIRVEGTGFGSGSQLRTPGFKTSSWRVASPTEIDFTLQEQTTLDAQPIQIISGVIVTTFYSYLRGKPLQDPSRALLKSTDPIFQLQTHALAQADPFSAQAPGQYIAFALQNPNPGPVVVTLNLTHSDSSVTSSAIVLPSGARIMDDIAALLNLPGIQAGDRFSLFSTSAIQILGLTVDENAGTVIPFLPTF